MPDSEINRSIYYYDLYTRNKIGDTDKYDYSSKLIKQFLMNLKEKQDIANDYEAFLKPTRNGNNEFLIVDNINDGHIRFRIVLCKNDALPFIEKKAIWKHWGHILILIRVLPKLHIAYISMNMAYWELNTMLLVQEQLLSWTICTNLS